MLLTLAICLAQQCKFDVSVVSDGDLPVVGARVILGELGRATLYYNTPEEMFLATPGLTQDEARTCSALLFTDEHGHIGIDGLSAGEYSIIAAYPKLGIAYTTLRLAADAPPLARLVLQPSAFVSASIEGPAFDPSAHVLELRPADLGVNISWIPRLEQLPGSWSFRSVALPAVRDWEIVGTQVVLEQDFRATLFSIPVSVEPGKESKVAFARDQGSIVSGRVVDTRGAPVRNVSVVAVSGRAPKWELGGVSDAEGRYTIQGLSTGKWRLDALRFGVRELPGCGNGPQELYCSRDFIVGDQRSQEIELRVNVSRTPPKVGELAPDFSATLLDGRELQLSKLRGKVVLLDFWATWCGMCRADFPRLVATYDAIASSSRFEIVGISIDKDVDLVRRFVASRGIRWPQTALGITTKNPLTQLYNVNSTPSTVLIGADGIVVALNLTGEALRTKIEELTSAKH